MGILATSRGIFAVESELRSDGLSYSGGSQPFISTASERKQSAKLNGNFALNKARTRELSRDCDTRSEIDFQTQVDR